VKLVYLGHAEKTGGKMEKPGKEELTANKGYTVKVATTVSN
jgi:hypothetical protein